MMWKHVDVCARCGGCGKPGGSSKIIFDREFDNVCITPMRFDNPSGETLEGLKTVAGVWKKLKILSK